jgi:hypothetical protein
MGSPRNQKHFLLTQTKIAFPMAKFLQKVKISFFSGHGTVNTRADLTHTWSVAVPGTLTRNDFIIQYIAKDLDISSHMRKPFLMYDLAPDP